jgi:hypothetical protein
MTQASSHRRGVALTALQAEPIFEGVPGPTRGEGRATRRAVTSGDQMGENRGVWRRLAGEQRTGGGGVGNGKEGPFYRRALEGKIGDNGCLHAGAQRALRRA